MLEWVHGMIQQGCTALQTSDAPALARLCAEAETRRPAQEQISPGEAAALQIRLAGLQRQVQLAGNNVRLRQMLLDSRTGGQRTWAP